MTTTYIRTAFFIGLCAASGCASSGSADDSGGAPPPDLTVSHVMSPDLAMGQMLPVYDLAMLPTPDLTGACLHYDTWPNVMPQGIYDDTYAVTYVTSLDVNMAPANALTIEDYVAMGETYPKMVTYSNTDTYSMCDVCPTVAICDNSGCKDTYFAQAGSVTVTRADRDAMKGEMIATASNLMLVEWDFSMNGDTAVPNGRCITIGAATFDVKWGGTDGGTPQPDMATVNHDMAVVHDMATPVDAKGADMAGVPPADMARTPVDMAGACHPVINELQATGVSATDEFVEIYNPCKGIDLTGWRLVYRSSANNNGRSDTSLYTFPANVASPYVLIVGKGYMGAATPDGQATSGLAGAGGAVALLDANNNRVDSVAYQVLSVANDFTEGGGPAPNPPAMESIARLPNGTDTDDNSKDFQVSAKPTPGAINK